MAPLFDSFNQGCCVGCVTTVAPVTFTTCSAFEQPAFGVLVGNQVDAEILFEHCRRGLRKFPAEHAGGHQQAYSRTGVAVGSEVLAGCHWRHHSFEGNSIRVGKVEIAYLRVAGSLFTPQKFERGNFQAGLQIAGLP